MAPLTELAADYRRAAAKLAIRIKEKEDAGELSGDARRSLREALNGIREVQRLLDSYYEAPRKEGISAAGWIAKKDKYEDD